MDFCVLLVHIILKLVLAQLSSLTECLAIFCSDFVNVYLANLFNLGTILVNEIKIYQK